MEYEIAATTAVPQLIAAVRARVRRGEVGIALREPLDKVWAFLRRHDGLRSPNGHNLFLYHHEPMVTGFFDIDFGVQVARRFEQDGDVRCVETPGGEGVSTIHRGPYDQLAGAHSAVHAWCRENGKRIGGCSWEIYGDWTDDVTKLETTIVYLLQR
jgi:effector-binding domain-containing protein